MKSPTWVLVDVVVSVGVGVVLFVLRTARLLLSPQGRLAHRWAFTCLCDDATHATLSIPLFYKRKADGEGIDGSRACVGSVGPSQNRRLCRCHLRGGVTTFVHSSTQPGFRPGRFRPFEVVLSAVTIRILTRLFACPPLSAALTLFMLASHHVSTL